MEENKASKKSIYIFMLIFLVIVIIAMCYFSYKFYNDKVIADNKIQELNNEINKLEKDIANLQGKINTSSNTNTSRDIDKTGKKKDNSNIKDVIENEENEDDDIIGTWNTYKVIDGTTAEVINNLAEIFGTSYKAYGSYLKLNQDGTFLDSIYSITSDEFSVEGTYTIEKDYYKLGDCYVFLNYSDGRTKTFMRIYYEDDVPVLSYYDYESKYQFDLKK